MIRKQCWSLVTALLVAAVADAKEDLTFVIRGRVVDADAKPVPGAIVRLLAPGSGGFGVDEKTTTDAKGQFGMAAPKIWCRMDLSQRQELGLLAVKGNQIAVLQFSRTSAPPEK